MRESGLPTPARGYDASIMPTTRRRQSRRRLLAVLAALVTAAIAVAGCAGSSGAGTGTDPASLVPASAPVYVEAVLAGNGREQQEAQAALQKILGTANPQGQIAALFDQSGVQFARDVEPWLGDRVGAATLSFGRTGDRVVVAASRDDTAASAALGRILPGASERSYRGVSYRVATKDGRPIAAAVVGDAVVFGSENALKAAIDASKGSSLAESDQLKQARSTVRQERSGLLYVDVAGVLRQALGASGGGAAQLAPFVDPVAQALPRTFAAALDAEPGLLRVDSAAFGNGGGTPASGSGANALAGLPGDAWLGLGVGELGKTVNGFIDRVSQGNGLAGVGIQALLAQAQQGLGLDIRRDVLAWMGDAGVFVTGASGDEAQAALVVASKDPAATRRAVDAFERLVRDNGGSVSALHASGVDQGFAVQRDNRRPDLLVAAAGDNFVLAGGRTALEQAISPSVRLGDAAAFRDAAAKLSSGVQPSFFVDVQKLNRLASAAKSDAHARDLQQRLRAFGAVVGGAKRDGDVTRGEAVATLP
jgi:hypothetical protein